MIKMNIWNIFFGIYAILFSIFTICIASDQSKYMQNSVYIIGLLALFCIIMCILPRWAQNKLEIK